MRKLDQSKITKNLGKKYKLVPYLDRALKTFDEPFAFTYEPKQGDSAWHPSGHCTPSPFELYHHAREWEAEAEVASEMGEPIPSEINEVLRKAFLVGHYWHQLLQYVVLNKLEFCSPEAIERRGQRVWSYWPDYKGLRMIVNKPFGWATGSGDIAPLEVPNWKGIVDFKTMNSRHYKLSGIPDDYAEKYECQINIYMDFFNEEKALIVAINKDSPHGFKEFEYERNQPLIDVIYEKWEYVSTCLDQDEEPHEEEDYDLPTVGPINV